MRTDVFVSRQLKQKVNNELASGERVQWMAQPKPRFFSPSTTAIFLFAIPWTGFAVFWMYGASSAPFGGFSLFGVPFVLIGIGMLAIPFWVYYKSLNSIYAITNRRAMTIEGGRAFTIRSYPPEKLQDIYRRERENGFGDIIFAFDTWEDSDGDSHKNDLGFLNIQEPKRIEKMLKKLAGQ